MADFNIYEELMPKIQALIAPPGNGNKEKHGLDMHLYFRKKGKKHNHDYCDACGGKGNIVCCDRCPASFHLLCHDPPLSELEFLNRRWYCHACKYSLGKNQDNLNRNLLLYNHIDVGANSSSIKRRNTFDSHTNHYSKEKETGALKRSKMNNTQTLHNHNDSAISINTVGSISKASLYNRIEEIGDTMVDIKDEPKEFDLNNQDKKKCEDGNFVQNKEFSSNPSKDKNDNESSYNNVSIKTEPSSDDSAAEHEDSIANLNVEDVCKIIGVNKGVKVYTGRTHPRTLSKYLSSTPLLNSSADKILLTKPCKVKLRHCDYLLKDSKNITSSVKNTVENTNSNIHSSNILMPLKLDDIPKDDAGIVKILFEDILRNAKRKNPKQFTLPNEYTRDLNLNIVRPEKDPDSLINDLDSSDLLKLPPRRCYYCNGTCLSGQMVNCDYCPAHFHLNCLDPPMCNLPDSKWMCDLHPHRILDKVMKNPSSLTELLHWWDKLSVPINDDDVKSKFLDKVKSIKKNPVHRPLPSSVKIPDIVKYHYKNPLRRVPTLSDYLYSEGCVFQDDFMLTKHNSIAKSNNCCDYVQDTEEHYNIEDDYINTNTSELVNDNHVLNDIIIDRCLKYNLRPPKKTKKNTLIEIVSDDAEIKPYNNVVSEEKSSKLVDQSEDLSLWDDVNKRFKFSSFGIYDNHHSKDNSSNNAAVIDPQWKCIENTIGWALDKNLICGGSTFSKLEDRLRSILMKSKMKHIVKDYPPSFWPYSNPYPFYHVTQKEDRNSILPALPKRKVKAVLCPLSHRAPLIYMYDNTLSIGTDLTNDVCLTLYGDCNFVSREHAIIFYDQVTRSYELLNYSEYATVVDGVHYTCDISADNQSSDNLSCPNIRLADMSKNENLPRTRRKITAASSIKRAHSPTVDYGGDSKRKLGSVAMAAEARNTYKRLLQDIDKLVTKSQEEMNRIADDDLNEISKAIRNNTMSNSPVCESNDKLTFRKKTAQCEWKKKKNNNTEDFIMEVGLKNIRSQSNSMSSSTKELNQVVDKDCTKERKNFKTKKRSTRRRRKYPDARKKLKGRRLIHRSNNRHNRDMIDCLQVSLVRLPQFNIKNNTETKTQHNDDKNEQLQEKGHLLANDFTTVNKETQCKCQQENLKFPNAYDSSWEKSALLYHGSYIRFGCIEFVFSIVNYPAPLEERLYAVQKETTQDEREKKKKEKTKPTSTAEKSLPKVLSNNENQNDENAYKDLSAHLISILNTLSKTSSSNKSSISTKSSVSSPSPSLSSPSSSRSTSPFCLSLTTV